jgi:hypothetical protein
VAAWAAGDKQHTSTGATIQWTFGVPHLVIPEINHYPCELEIVSRFWSDTQTDLCYQLIANLPHLWYAANFSNKPDL